MITKFTKWHVWLWHLTKWRVDEKAVLLYFCAMSFHQFGILSSAVSSIRCINMLNCQPLNKCYFWDKNLLILTENPFLSMELLHLLHNWQNGTSVYGIWRNGKLTKQHISFILVWHHLANLPFCQLLFKQSVLSATK